MCGLLILRVISPMRRLNIVYEPMLLVTTEAQGAQKVSMFSATLR